MLGGTENCISCNVALGEPIWDTRPCLVVREQSWLTPRRNGCHSRSPDGCSDLCSSWGSQYLCAPTHEPPSVDSCARLFLTRIRNIPFGSCAPPVLSGWKSGIVRVQAQPQGLGPNPTVSLANSPVSPVDRRRLLTALFQHGWLRGQTKPAH